MFTCGLTSRGETIVAFHLSGLSGSTIQFLNGTYEFSEQALAKMSLLMDQSRSVLSLRSVKARELGELWQIKMYTRALDLSI